MSFNFETLTAFKIRWTKIISPVELSNLLDRNQAAINADNHDLAQFYWDQYLLHRSEFNKFLNTLYYFVYFRNRIPDLYHPSVKRWIRPYYLIVDNFYRNKVIKKNIKSSLLAKKASDVVTYFNENKYNYSLLEVSEAQFEQGLEHLDCEEYSSNNYYSFVEKVPLRRTRSSPELRAWYNYHSIKCSNYVYKTPTQAIRDEKLSLILSFKLFCFRINRLGEDIRSNFSLKNSLDKLYKYIRDTPVLGDDSIEMQDIVPIACEAESDTPVDVGGIDNVKADQASNVVLTESRLESTDIPIDHIQFDWNNMASNDVQSEFNTIVDRWLCIDNFNWSKDSVQDSLLKSYVLPRFLFDYNPTLKQMDTHINVPNLLPFRIHRYAKFDMEIKIQVNSNKFQIGQLQCAWYYSSQLDGKFSLRQNIWSSSQTNHVLISASSSNEALLDVPFMYHLPYLNCKERSDMPNALELGTLFIRVLNPLTIGVGGPSSCGVSLFVKFKNCEFTGMCDGSIDAPVFAQKQSPMERIIGDVSRLALNTLFPEPNRDNPTNPIPANYIVPVASHSWSAGTGVSEPLNSLRLDLRGQVPHPGMNAVDEMSVDFVKNMYGFINTIKWKKDHVEGDLLASFEACPLPDVSVFRKQTGSSHELDMYYLPPIAILSSLFAYWRGSIDFRLDIISSMYHTGRLLLSYIPGATRSTSVTLAQARSSPHVVFTLNEQNMLSYVIPFIANKPFWPRKYTGNYSSDQCKPPSMFYVFVLNPLIPMQSVSDTVYINFYMRGGTDFEVSIPVQPSIGLAFNRTVLYSKTELIYAEDSSNYPYYAGSYYNFAASKGLVMRDKTTSGGRSWFDGRFENKQKGSGIYYKCESITDSPTAVFNDKTEGHIGYCILFIDIGTAKWLMIPVKTEADAIAAAQYMRGNKYDVTSAAELVNRKLCILSANGTTSNQWSNGNPPWSKHQITQLSEAEGERDGVVASFSSNNVLMSTQSGSLLFGEKFNDLKDLLRRYQVYSIFTVEYDSDAQIGQCAAILPVLAQGLDLNISINTTKIFELPNRCRDGIIPIIASAYRWYRGSIRFRLVVPTNFNALVWIQHRPDRALRSTSIIRCTSVETAEAVANHGYASFLQLTSVNGIVEFEVPFYQPGIFSLLQRPAAISTLQADVKYHIQLGEVCVGFIYNKKTATDLVATSATMYYSMGDDMRFYTFQGYPPVVMLDDISSVVPTVECACKRRSVDVESFVIPCQHEGPVVTVCEESPSVPTFVPAIPLPKPSPLVVLNDPVQVKSSGFFSGLRNKISSSIKEDVSVTVNEAITPLLSEATKMFEDFKTSTELPAILENNTFKSILMNFIHVVLNPSIKTFAWSIVSIFVEIGLLTMSVINKAVDKLVTFLKRMSPNKPNSGEKVGSAIPCEKQSSAEAATGFITLLWTSMCSVLNYKAKPPKNMTQWSTFLTKDCNNVLRSSNSMFSFIRNILSVSKSMYDYILECLYPIYAKYKTLSFNHDYAKMWVHEVYNLCDPNITKHMPYDQELIERVHVAHAEGMVLMGDLSAKDIPAQASVMLDAWRRLNDVRNDLIQLGHDSFVRKLPFTICLHGQPGIGKSELTSIMTADLLACVQYNLESSLMCVVDPLSDYWNQCDNQPVLMVDDMFAIEIEEPLVRQLGLLFMVVSPIPLTPPMAALEDKKRRYNPEIFVYCTNKPFVRIPNINLEAVYRRRDILLEARLIRFKPEVVGDDTLPAETKAGCMHCEQQYANDHPDCVKLLSDFHHLRFRIAKNKLDPKTEYTEWMTYAEMMKLLTVQFRTNRERAAAMFIKNVENQERLRSKFKSYKMDNSLPLDERKQIMKVDNLQYSNAIAQCTISRYICEMGTSFVDKFKTEIIPKFSRFSVSESLKLFDIVVDPFKLEEPEAVACDVESIGTWIDSLLNASFFSKVNSKIAIPLEKDEMVCTTPCFPTRYDQIDAFISNVTPSTSVGVNGQLIFLRKWYDLGIINAKMLNEGLAIMEYELHNQSENTLFLFQVLSPLIKEHLCRYPFGFRSWDIVLDVLTDISNKTVLYHSHRSYNSFCCAHSNVRFDEAVYDPDRKSCVYKKFDLVKECTHLPSGFCLLKSAFCKYLFWRKWLISDISMLRAYRAQKYNLLPPIFSPASDYKFPEAAEWTTIFKASVKSYYETYFSPIVKKICKFFKIIAPLLAALGMFAAICGVSAIYCNYERKEDLAHIKDRCAVISDACKSWEKTEFESTNYSLQNNVNLNASVPTASFQGTIPQFEVALDRIKRNFLTLSCVYDGKVIQYSCLVLRGREVLFLRHFFEEIRALPPGTKYYGRFDNMPTVACKYGIEFNLNLVSTLWMNVRNESGDYTSSVGLFELPKSFPECKDLVKFIAKNKDHISVSGTGSLVSPSGRISENLQIVRSNVRPHAINPDEHVSTVVMDDVYTYPVHGRGMCGSILLASNLERPIIGVHVAGVTSGKQYGIAEILCYENFVEVIPPEKSYESYIVPKLDDLEFSKIDIDTAIFPVGVVVPKLAQSQSGNSNIVPSLIQGVFPIQTAPNPLKSSDPRLPKDSGSPLSNGCAHFGKPPLDFEPELLDNAREDLQDVVLSSVKPPRAVVGVVPFDVAIVGDSAIHGFEPLEWSTSEGYPLKAIRPKGATNKRWLFDLKESPEGYKLGGVHSELKRLYQLEMGLRARNIRPFTVFTDCLKDTCLPIEKNCVPGKTRVFSVSPVQFTIAFKQYFLDFMVGYQNARFDCEHGIGIDVNSYEWTVLAGKLCSKGGKIIAGDYKNFGPGLMKSAASRAFEIILAWYSKHGASEQDQQIRRILISEIINCYHLCLNLIFQTPCGIPSGSPITAPLNSLVNSLYIRCVYSKICNLGYRYLHENAFICTYGDDIVIGVSDELSKCFNTVSMSEMFARYNIVFTDADKSSELIPFRDISSATFLKCSFIPHPTRSGEYLAALDKKSIEGCANWISKKGNHATNTVVNAEMALMLAHGHGKQYYDEIWQKLSLALSEKNLPRMRADTWRDLDLKRSSLALAGMYVLKETPI